MSIKPVVFLINGPNLNLLGVRQPEIYGRDTLADIEAASIARAAALGLDLVCRQSNHEGVLVDLIHQARTEAAGLIINPGAYSHTSVAIHDALKAFEGPILEVHISNIHQREAFRHHSYVSLVAHGVIAGFGVFGYQAAILKMADLIRV